MQIEAGRTYRVITPSGDCEVGEATFCAEQEAFLIAGWYVNEDGSFPGVKGYRVERVEPAWTIGVKGQHISDSVEADVEPETTEARHAADEQDMQHDGLPRLHPLRLKVRRVHALERIAEALEAVVYGTDVLGVPKEEAANEGT